MHTVHEPAGPGPFPTILALHGWGSNAHDLLGLAPYLLDGEALVLCPQGPVSVPTGPGSEGHGWFPITGGGPPDPGALDSGVDSARGFLDKALERYPVDPKRLVVLGFSQGGVMAYQLFLQQPERFAGLAALSSWLPRDLARQAAPLPQHADRPVLVIHGTEDPMIPIDRARDSKTALEPFATDLTYHEFPMGHEVSSDALRALMGWIDTTFAGAGASG